MKRPLNSSGLSLVELLVYLGILGIVMLGVTTSLRYFRSQSTQVQIESQLTLEAQRINSFLRAKISGSNTVQSAPGYTSSNGNYCYRISENKPVTFDSANITNGANFQYRVTAATGPQRNAESKLSSSNSLGMSASTQAASIRRTLSMWVKLSNVDGNNRVLFDYSPASGNAGYKMVVRVASSSSIGVDMGMGLSEFTYSVPDIRNGDWHHLAVVAGDLTVANSTPTLYVDGSQYTTTRSGTYSFTQAARDYQINIGNATSAAWSLGPVGLWSRALNTTEIARLGRSDNVNVDNAFWLSNPQSTLSTQSSDVSNIKTVNARIQQGFLLFKKDSTSNGQDFYKIYHIESASSCPDSAPSDNPVNLGFTEVTTNTCASPAGTSPLLIGAGTAGQSLGFQWRCNLVQNKQVAQASLVTGNSTTAVKKSGEACGLPILESDFATTDSANTAYIIIDNFDANIDLMAFKPSSGANVWPTQMTSTTSSSGESITAVPAVSNGTVTVTWYADSANNVGMMKVVTNPLTSQTKDWWVTNVFKKIIYKSKTDVYASERKIVFALGDAWPIKVCQGLGYKSSYHFYRVQTVNPAKTTFQAYQDAYQNRSYFGMTGYLGNLRCENEKEQVSSRVLDLIGSNVSAIIGAWATRQSSTDANSTPNFATGRESVNGSTTSNDTWNAGTFANPSDMYNVPGGNNNGIPRNAEQLAEAGRIQWRWIGGPTVDHNVIMLTDYTLCRGETTRSEGSKKGCTGMNTITVDYSCPTPANNSPACLLQSQSGGNRQYGWWHQAEPNESGAYIWMGYDAGVTGSNYWDDAGVSSTNTRYLLEFGDHPWDAVRGPSSKYKTAHATAGDTSTNLDPPNVASKTVNTVKAQYCQ